MFIDFLLSLEADQAFYRDRHSTKIEHAFTQDNIFGHVHTNPISSLVVVSHPKRLLVTASTDTVIKFWDFDRAAAAAAGQMAEPVLLGTVHHENKNSAMLSGILEAMDRDQRSSYIQKVGVKRSGGRTVVLSITSIAALPLSPHVVVTSSDCCVTLYETIGRSACGRVTDLEDVPTAVACFSQSVACAGQGGGHTLNQRVAFGDSLGFLRIVELPHEFNHSLEVGSKRKCRALFEAALTSKATYYRAKIHDAWVAKMEYVPELRCLFCAASSPDFSISAVDFTFSASAPISSRVGYYRGHVPYKSVVCALGYSALTKHMVSAGGRVVLVWDPHTMQTLFTIEGGTAPLVGMSVSDEDRRIYLCQKDKIVRLYDVETLEPAQIAVDHANYSPIDELSAMAHLSQPSRLVTAGNRLSGWSVLREGLPEEEAASSSKEDLASCLYSAVFLVVVAVMNLGGVSVYDVRTGALIRRFHVGHMTNLSKDAGDTATPNPDHDQAKKQSLGGGPAAPCVVAACLDQKQMLLLLVTRDGYFQTWNFHCGECLFSTVPSLQQSLRLPEAGEKDVDSAVACIAPMIGLFGFHNKTQQSCLLVGARSGAVAVLRAESSGIDATPRATLRRPPSESGDVCESSVLWIESVLADRVAVGYLDGSVLVWSTVTDCVVAEARIGQGRGMVLRCMRRMDGCAEEEEEGTGAGAGATVTAACCVYVSRAHVLLLACTDGHIRIVDARTGLVQGSVRYSSRGGATMQRLALSRAEDVLAGVMSDFSINIWSVHQQAFKLLATAVSRATHTASDPSGFAITKKAAATAEVSVQQQQGLNAAAELLLRALASHMATSPLQAVSSFAGVQSPAVSLAFSSSFRHSDADVVTDAAKGDVVDSYDTAALRQDHMPTGYLLCASVNKQVALWRTDGRLVGTCGSTKYDVDDEATFVDDERDVIDSSELSDRVVGSLSPRPPQSSRSSAAAGRAVTLSYKDKRHSSADLNRYVERLQRGIASKSRVPGSDYMDRHYSKLVADHPVDFSAGDFDYRAFMRERNIVAKSEGL